MNARPDGTGSGVAVVRRIADGGVLTRTIPGPPAIPRYGVPGAFVASLFHLHADAVMNADMPQVDRCAKGCMPKTGSTPLT